METSNGLRAGAAAMDTTALLSLLQGYPTTSEVKYFIDEAVNKFVEKRLRPLVSAILREEERPEGGRLSGDGDKSGGDAAARASQNGDEAQSSPSSKPKSGGGGGGAVDVDWLSMLVRAQLEADLLQHAQLLVKREVSLQLREALSGSGGGSSAPVHTLSTSPPPSARPPRPPATPSPPPSGRHADPNDDEHATSSPPPPPQSPPLFRGLDDNEEEEKGEGTEGSSAEADPSHPLSPRRQPASTTTTSPTAAAGDAGRKQRERILSAIHDVEHQLNGLQRQVNELAHQHRLGQRRMAAFFAAAHRDDDDTAAGSRSPRTTASPNTSTSSGNYSTFYASLLQALDERELAKVRGMARETMAALLPPPQAPTAGGIDAELMNADVSAATSIAQSGRQQQQQQQQQQQRSPPSQSTNTQELAQSTEVMSEEAAKPYDNTTAEAAAEYLSTPLRTNPSSPPSPPPNNNNISHNASHRRAAKQSSGIIAVGSKGGDTVPPPPPPLQLSHTAATAAVPTDAPASAKAGATGGGSRPSAPVAAAAQQLAHLLDTGSGTRHPSSASAAYSNSSSNNNGANSKSSGPPLPHTPVELTLNQSHVHSSHQSSATGDSPPPITRGARTRAHDAAQQQQQQQERSHPYLCAAAPTPNTAFTPGTSTPVRDYLLTAATGSPSRTPTHQRKASRSPAAKSAAGSPTGNHREQSKARKGYGGATSSPSGYAVRAYGGPSSSSDITLGVDAIDLPAGVLPSSLGLRGGVRVLAVGRGQVAERSGVVAGDVVIAAAGRVVETCAQLQQALREAQGQAPPLRLDLYRHTANLVFTITLDV